jgi:hypothetical protein
MSEIIDAETQTPQPDSGTNVSLLLPSRGGKSAHRPKLVRLATRRGPQLDSLIAVRKEMSKNYRDVWRGQLASDEGSRRAFMLKELLKAVEMADIEPRLADIERQLQLR